MKFTHLKLLNWKNFQRVDTTVVDRMLVYGLNASGKSNFLDAFRFLRDVARQGGGLENAVRTRGGYSKIRSLHAHGGGNVCLEVQLSGDENAIWQYHLEFKGPPRGNQGIQAIVTKEWVKHNDVTFERDVAAESADTRQETLLQQGLAGEHFGEVRRALGQIRYLHLVPQLLKHPAAFDGPDLPDDPFGKGFLEAIAKTGSREREKRINAISKAMSGAIPSLEALQYKPDLGKPHLIAKFRHWRGVDAEQNETQFSDGTLRLIGLLWSMLSIDGLLLLEEPELSLNSEIVKQIPGMISYVHDRRMNTQVILTTHTLDMVDDEGIALEETFQVVPGDKGSTLESMAHDKPSVDLFKNKLPLRQIVHSRVRAVSPSQLFFKL